MLRLQIKQNNIVEAEPCQKHLQKVRKVKINLVKIMYRIQSKKKYITSI
jgi:hypothetical protein